MNEPGAADTPTQSETDLARQIREETLPFDPTLGNLVSLINVLDETEISVILYVSGVVVSGMLISAQKYYRLLIGGMSDPSRRGERTSAEATQFFADFFKPVLQSLEKDLKDYRDFRKVPSRPHHIHLRHAQSFVSGSEPLPGVLWRGRLTAIDAWSIGNYGEVPPALPSKDENAHKLVAALTNERPELGLVNVVVFGVTIDGTRIVAVSDRLYDDLQATARSSGGSPGLGAILADIASRAVDEKSGQIGPALESTVTVVVDGAPKPPARVLIERVAPDAAIMRYHPAGTQSA